jgi:uncharacterized protein YoxC
MNLPSANCGVRHQIMSEVFPYIVIAVLLIIIVLLSKLLSQLKYMTSLVYKTLNNTSDIDDIANHTGRITEKLVPIDEKLKNIQNILSANRAEKLGKYSDTDDY